MSMPIITVSTFDLNAAVNNLLAALALVEAGLAHVLNAEGEKIQKAIQITGLTIDEIIELNNSVGSVVHGVVEMEDTLKDEMSMINALLKAAGPAAPVTPPAPPVTPPAPPPISPAQGGGSTTTYPPNPPKAPTP